jgi:DNA-binding HxlR family transcriptional regulator
MEGSFSNHDVSERLPDVSSVMIQQELSKMSEEGLIMRSGTTKGTQYTIKSL